MRLMTFLAGAASTATFGALTAATRFGGVAFRALTAAVSLLVAATFTVLPTGLAAFGAAFLAAGALSAAALGAALGAAFSAAAFLTAGLALAAGDDLRSLI